MTKGSAFDFSAIRKKPMEDVPKEVDAELDAVAERHGFRSREVAAEEPSKRVDFTTSNTPEVAQLKAELALAEARAEAAERLAQERADRIEDLRRMLPAPQPSRPRFRWPWNH